MYLDDNLLKIAFIVATWEFIWKGFALWKSARNNQRNWFLVMLFINTLGILPMLYLKFFQKKKKRS